MEVIRKAIPILKLAKKLGVLLNVNPFMPVGKGTGKDNLLTDEEKKNYREITINNPTITTHTKTIYDSQYPAGHLYLGILPDGEILPCYFLPVSVGNIVNISIQEAQKRSLELGFFKTGQSEYILVMNKKFYFNIIKELYLGKYKLPIRYN